MQTVTIKFLQSVCDRINKATNSPMVPYVKGDDGKHHAQIGNYHLSQAYGGVSLHRMYNEGGGVSDVFSCGHVSKRNLSERMFAFINGIDSAKVQA